MTKVLDIVDASLQEIEEQLLDEFKRIRNSLSDAPFETIDKGIQSSLSDVIQELLRMLENSGDKTNLQLQTERHETLFARASVIKQLLKAKIPTAYLHEIHKEVKTFRKKLEIKVVAKREQKTEAENTPKNAGLLDSIKNLFSRNKSKQETLRNRIKVTDQEAKEFDAVEIYQDSGVYSASRELAMLSTRLVEAGAFKNPTESKKENVTPDKAPQSAPSGKALFESKDLSQQAPPLKKDSIAQTPEEIRRKLENNQPKPNTTSTFKAKEVTQTTLKAESKKIALSPEEIRQKLAARQQPSNMGKATFESKDVEHAMSNTGALEPGASKAEAPKSPQDPETEPSPSKGKAVFESKDLSSTGPTRKR
ncbi:MAG: hypothetical protein JKY88_01615 [Pseudomonadales bacterium]|nr:hypothetical protein [Pseudomonadales bacterium]